MFERKNQNKVFAIGFVLILIVVAWSFVRPAISRLGDSGENSDKKINEEIMKAPAITPDSLFKKISAKDNKAFIFDLRDDIDFNRGHIEASVNISSDSLNSKALGSSGADKTSDIVITNEGEDVFGVAKKVNDLVANGFSNTKYLQGGISAWKNKGYLLVSSGGGEADESKIKKVSASQLISAGGSGSDSIQFIDVRDKQVFSTGHIPSAINIPLSELEKDQDKISPVKKVIVYGKDEDEAKRSAITLFDLSFFNAYVLEGGLDEWKKSGGKME